MIAVRGELLITPRDQFTRAFQLLIQDLADATGEGNFRASETKESIPASHAGVSNNDNGARCVPRRVQICKVLLPELMVSELLWWR
ncbi:hypothetical protein L3X38_022469 [Prunus dulcis]|uniref:Uncharacterized protein n=1 Tax=Prunus dulcis TaxID=3755 RepID=A0AAD4VW19_PRUDU|nr:hypothetical protein L3X38_022469 [Prunus dulcis]